MRMDGREELMGEREGDGREGRMTRESEQLVKRWEWRERKRYIMEVREICG